MCNTLLVIATTILFNTHVNFDHLLLSHFCPYTLIIMAVPNSKFHHRHVRTYMIMDTKSRRSMARGDMHN